MILRIVALLGLSAPAVLGAQAHAQSNVSPVHKHAWGENIGWTNWRDAGPVPATDGVRVTPAFLLGRIWAENLGWITLGDSITAGSVLVSPTGELSGYAWGENSGWISFNSTPDLIAGALQPRFDLSTHRFHGYAWGENVGWINLDHPIHFICAVPTDVSGDANVGFADISVVLANWGNIYPGGTGAGDANGDGTVGFPDITAVLAAFGDACP
jgi:hypothetical protein